MLLEIPPKYAASQEVGYIERKDHNPFCPDVHGAKRYFTGQHLWERGYFVSMVSGDEAVIREYIRNQELENKRAEHVPLFR